MNAPQRRRVPVSDMCECEQVAPPEGPQAYLREGHCDSFGCLQATNFSLWGLMPDASQGEFPEVWILEPAAPPPSAGSATARIFGLTSAERLIRTLARLPNAGIQRVGPGPLPAGPAAGRVVLFRADHFYDERLVHALMESSDCLLGVSSNQNPESEPVAAAVRGSQAIEVTDLLWRAAAGEIKTPPSGIRECEPLELVPAYNSQLRKFDPPFLFPARAGRVREAENRAFAASYKGITDFITKQVFPRPALAVVRVLARHGVQPNTVTFWSYVLTAFVILAFSWGWFGMGLLAGWLMTFLDTVDGKLARVTLTSSKLGGFLDHALDMVHPPIWWWAWAVGIGLQNPGVEACLWIIVGGYVLGRILEGIFLACFKMEMFTWRPFDARFRAVIARRNPNLLLLSIGVILGRPEVGYMAVAIWTLVCIGVAMVRIGQAGAAKLRGQPIQSWYEEATSERSATLDSPQQNRS